MEYLLTSNSHPIQCTRDVPYSLALKIVRILSRSIDKEKRFQELKDLLWKGDTSAHCIIVDPPILLDDFGNQNL